MKIRYFCRKTEFWTKNWEFLQEVWLSFEILGVFGPLSFGENVEKKNPILHRNTRACRPRRPKHCVSSSQLSTSRPMTVPASPRTKSGKDTGSPGQFCVKILEFCQIVEFFLPWGFFSNVQKKSLPKPPVPWVLSDDVEFSRKICRVFEKMFEFPNEIFPTSSWVFPIKPLSFNSI